MKLPPHKVLITDSVCDIPQRLKEYDKSFFIVYDRKREKYEVHSTDNLFGTYCLTVPYDELDERTLRLVRKGDTKNKGAYEIEKELDKHNAMIEDKQDREQKKWINDVARETHSAFIKDLDNEFIGMSRKWS